MAFFEEASGLASNDVYFETTKQAKLARIAAAGCTLFIDDLPELLDEPAFPAGVERILFDPNNQHGGHRRFSRMKSWFEAEDVVWGKVGAQQ